MAAMSRSSVRLGTLVLAAAALGLGLAACGVGDPSYTSDPGEPVNRVDLSSRPYCVGTCLPDYGSQRVDCQADDGLEFFPYDVLNGEDGAITGFYSYNDGTTEFMVSGPTAFSPAQANFEPDAVSAPGLCSADNQVTASLAHHIRGGLFREWGGGMGRRLVSFVTGTGLPCPGGPAGAQDPDFCPDADERISRAITGGVVSPGESGALTTGFYGMTADLRGWEGISFWARQGPNNTAGIRVYVGDRQLDEDIGYLEQAAGMAPLCRRARECGCRNHQPCTQSPAGLWLCVDPSEAASIDALRQEAMGRGELDFFERRYPLCGPTACDDINDAFQASDPVFATPNSGGTAQCLSYSLTNDVADYYCFDEQNPATFPPDGPERCGDGWARGVTLSSDWKFYKVPFTELRQEGYGKEFPYLDLSKITLVRFTWMQGWVDVWLDDVRFYRRAAPANGAGVPVAP